MYTALAYYGLSPADRLVLIPQLEDRRCKRSTVGSEGQFLCLAHAAVPGIHACGLPLPQDFSPCHCSVQALTFSQYSDAFNLRITWNVAE
jgi:hypothetical protein